MLNVQIDSEQLEHDYKVALNKAISEITFQKTFWDFKELMNQTCMSKSFILEKFFYEPDFPKYKVGQKWLMPAVETQEFLKNWLKKQSQN
ncbi:hypothetical protein KZO01_06070 [Kurthia zopfii]|uniref:Group-specific protein n=1 Tax=Kurthia zopfii TaxID=1650 RepID=A0A8B4Q5X5_9BACL|nr:group-specific protein [Kurthia zopfii]PWI23523.1 group-specific protein [Kurthia zopfii]TDR35551.1 hypothetical protein DFR61_13046 [Kurthia zopfii]GEK30298.1 hypothetical protein KZO01_06070 [Kurthia zopfii]STX09187.1 Uncharacterised protein [Kurthia zopfii]